MPVNVKLPIAGIANGWKYLVTKTAGARNWIVRHRVWIWAFAAIGFYLLISQYLYNLIGSHYQHHPPEQGHFRIDNLSFWDRDSEGARNLIFAIGGWLGVLAAIVGFVLAGFRTSTQLQMTQTAIDGQVTERFTRAVEQLGHEKRAVRLGAIYALERIAIDSPRDRDTIVETLAAYIRELAPWKPMKEIDKPPGKLDLDIGKPHIRIRPATDISVALTVVCRMLESINSVRENVDLRHTDLRGIDAPEINLSFVNLDLAVLKWANLRGAILISAELNEADLSSANLSRTNMTKAKMRRVNLSEADMNGANLCRAELISANLNGTYLSEANLNRAVMYTARLGNASLSKSNLFRADLSGADLTYANLLSASLMMADLSGADLHMADLSGANLSGADLTGVKYLSQDQVSRIRYHRGNPPRNLPAGLTLPEPYDV